MMKKEYISPLALEIMTQPQNYLLIDILSGLDDALNSEDHSGNSGNIIDEDFD